MPDEKRQSRRWRRWVAVIGIVLLLLLLAVPFVFTCSLVLWIANRSGYAAFTPALAAATLSPGGGLTLRNVILHEPGGNTPLLEARQVDLSFTWGGLWNHRLQSVTIHELAVYLRDLHGTPSILQLATPQAATPATQPAGSTVPSWTIGRLVCQGVLHATPVADVATSRSEYPFDVTCSLSAVATPSPNFQLHLGDDAEHVRLDGTFDGTIFHGTLDLRMTQLERRGAKPAGLEDLQAKATLALVPGRDLLNSLAIDHGSFHLGRITTGKTSATALSANLDGKTGLLDITALRATFAGGDFDGDLHFNLPNARLLSGKLAIRHLDQRQVAANLAPDRLEAEGTVSGTLELTGLDGAALGGTILLDSDGPGRLKIKDEQVANALAQKLETNVGTSAGLPANFNTIVVEQLKNYPYTRGHIEVRVVNGTPVVTLNYVRDPIKEGEAGYGVETELAGQKVKANYTVQLPGLSVVLKGKTLEELLALAAGLAEK